MYDADHETAIACYREATAIAREIGDERGLSLAIQNLGIAHADAGNREPAIEALEESVALARRAGDPGHLSSTQRSLARVLLDDDRPRALALLRESLERSSRLADRNAIVECLETAAAAASDPVLLGTAEALRAESAGAPARRAVQARRRRGPPRRRGRPRRGRRPEARSGRRPRPPDPQGGQRTLMFVRMPASSWPSSEQ